MLTRINNDTNGNPRYVCHFLQLINDDDRERCTGTGDVGRMYKIALDKAKLIGGKKYHTKSYGGGIVFQSYNTNVLEAQINNLKTTTNETSK